MDHPKQQLAARLRTAALVVLAIGAIGGTLIFSFASEPPPTGTSQLINGQVQTIDALDDPQVRFQVERMSGRTGWYVFVFQHKFARLWEGPTLGVTLGVLALLAAGILAFVAREIDAMAVHEHEHEPAA